MEQPTDYSKWSNKELIDRVSSLERQLREQTAKVKSGPTSPKPPSPVCKTKNARVHREFDPSKYSTRSIALKFAYLGQRYNGLEFHTNNKTPLPTVEEELWKALNKARLVFPTSNPLLESHEPNWEGCGYSKCGRTDKGVSAFGQVVSIRVRSNRPVGQVWRTDLTGERAADMRPEEIIEPNDLEKASPPLNPAIDPDNGISSPPSTQDSPSEESPPFDPVHDEIPYCQILNRILPPDIRMLAWCPTPPPDFSARFSCKERQYRYYFTQPAFVPTVGPTGLHSETQTDTTSPARRRREGWLDIEAMRIAAHKFVGLHDFRNFCKIDGSKQIENFERRIYHADIQYMDPRHHPLAFIGTYGFDQYENRTSRPNPHLDPALNAEPFTPTVYAFTLHGSAFLWHQVRHMVAILFLIGQGLEPPSLIDNLLDIRKTPCKPQYEMADDAPLVLWDCIFPREGSTSRHDALDWIYVGDSAGAGTGIKKASKRKDDGKYGIGGVADEIWRVWRGRKIDEVLAGTLLDVVVGQGDQSVRGGSRGVEDGRPRGDGMESQKVFQGGNGPRLKGKYIPVMQRSRMESVEAVNAKYAKRKGFEQSEEVRELGYRRVLGDADAEGDVGIK